MHCCISGCRNVSAKHLNKSNVVKFYYFPKNSTHHPWLCEKRQKWINEVKNHTRRPNNWLPSKNTVICNAHFIGNKKSENPLHPSYLPTIFPGKKNNPQKVAEKLQRFENKQTQPQIQQSQFVALNTVKIEYNPEDDDQPERLAKQQSVGCQSGELLRGDQTFDTHLFCSLINTNGVCTAAIQTNMVPKKLSEIGTTAKGMNDFSCDPVDHNLQMLLCQGFQGITSIKTEENGITSSGSTHLNTWRQENKDIVKLKLELLNYQMETARLERQRIEEARRAEFAAREAQAVTTALRLRAARLDVVAAAAKLPPSHPALLFTPDEQPAEGYLRQYQHT